MRFVFLGADLRFPNPRLATSEGLVAMGGDFSTQRLLNAYRSGIFPWTAHPITWWSPDPRAIFKLDSFHVSSSLKKVLRKGSFTVTTDKAFKDVMKGCSEPTKDRPQSWVTEHFIEAYTRLHREGHAHSAECWQGETLVGGVYGVAIGGFFAGESMFHRVSNSSKVALYYLVQALRERGFQLFDTQMLTTVTASLGAVEIPRNTYLGLLADALAAPAVFPAGMELARERTAVARGGLG